MSYEGEMLKKLAMPSRKEVEDALLTTLFKHNGCVTEFSTGEEIVDEISLIFSLNLEQRKAVLERTYRKENRIIKTPLWHRLLYRAANSLANENLITRPTTTFRLTNKKEWMLTEAGYDKALKLLNIPVEKKELLQVKSYEVQKFVKKLTEQPFSETYNPVESSKKKRLISKELKIRSRGFQQAVKEVYGYSCAVCGLKIKSPDLLYWEVQAAHIVPHSSNGKDDVLNGIALCRLHHWAFDVGWFSLTDDLRVIVSSKSKDMPFGYGKMEGLDFFSIGIIANKPISHPENVNLKPHKNSILWHREKIFKH